MTKGETALTALPQGLFFMKGPGEKGGFQIYRHITPKGGMQEKALPEGNSETAHAQGREGKILMILRA